jgi:hypothetical protein
MLPPRRKLVRFQVESLGKSEHSPACEHLRLIAGFESEDGATVERSEVILAYPQIMSDPEQFPAQVAEALRAMMIEVRRQTPLKATLLHKD